MSSDASPVDATGDFYRAVRSYQRAAESLGKLPRFPHYKDGDPADDDSWWYYCDYKFNEEEEALMKTPGWAENHGRTLLDKLVSQFVYRDVEMYVPTSKNEMWLRLTLEELGLIDKDFDLCENTAVTREKCRQAAVIIFDQNREANLEAARSNTVANMRYYANMLGEDVPPGIFADIPYEEFPVKWVRCDQLTSP